jgi:hypothetical protein
LAENQTFQVFETWKVFVTILQLTFGRTLRMGAALCSTEAESRSHFPIPPTVVAVPLQVKTRNNGSAQKGKNHY